METQNLGKHSHSSCLGVSFCTLVLFKSSWNNTPTIDFEVTLAQYAKINSISEDKNSFALYFNNP